MIPEADLVHGGLVPAPQLNNSTAVRLLPGPDWFHVSRCGDVAHVRFMGEIGLLGKGASELLAEIGEAASIEFTIESRGGDSRQALAIYEGTFGRVTQATITGNCFSAAVILAMAARHIRMEAGARMMVHTARSFVFGSESELVDAASVVGRLNLQLREIISARTGIDAEKFFDGFDHYLTAEACEASGFCDSIFSELPPPLPATPPVAITEVGTETEQERDAMEILRALGTVTVRDRSQFTRAVAAWAMHNSKEITL